MEEDQTLTARVRAVEIVLIKLAARWVKDQRFSNPRQFAIAECDDSIRSLPGAAGGEVEHALRELWQEVIDRSPVR